MPFIPKPRKGGIRDTLVKRLGEGLDLVQETLDVFHDRTAEQLGVEQAHLHRRASMSKAHIPQVGDKVMYRSSTNGKEYEGTISALTDNGYRIKFPNGEKQLSHEDFRAACRVVEQESQETQGPHHGKHRDEVDKLNAKVPKVSREKVKEALTLCGGHEEQAWAVLTLFEVFPSVPLERIKTTLDSCSGDRQLASAALLQQPPSIRKDPEGWFKHFDLAGRGYLGKEDVIEALRLSFPGMTQDTAEWMLTWMWESIDADDNGQVNFEEFMMENGLRDLIVGELKSRRGDCADDDSDEEDGSVPAGGERQLIRKALDKLSDKGALGIYFAAALTRPFTRSTGLLQQRLAEYQRKGIDLQILVVSVDGTSEAYKKLVESTKDFSAVPFKPKRVRYRIAEMLDVQSVPSLIIMDKSGEFMTKDGLQAVHEDVEGESFPWKGWSSTPAVVPVEGDATSATKKQVWRLVDDAEMEERAATMPLTQEAFQEVVDSKSIVALRQFLRRVAATKEWTVLSEAAFADYVWDQANSADDSEASLGQLLEDMAKASWISTSPPQASMSSLGSADSRSLRKGTIAVSAGKSFAALKTQQTVGGSQSSKSTPTQEAGLQVQGSKHEHEQLEPDPELHGTSAAVGTGGKGKAKGPGPKGAKGPASHDAAGSGADESSESRPHPADDTSEVQHEPDEKPGKGKGPQLPGKGKGPPPPAGKGPPPPAGKGPPPPAGKGPPPPAGKGPPPPAGKGPPAPGKGPKGGKKGAGKGQGLQPKRGDKMDWAKKKTPRLRWKRLVEGDEGLEKSYFGKANYKEAAINEEDLAHWAEDTRKERPTVRKAKAVKPILWEPTEKQDSAKRRMSVALLMKSKWKEFGRPFLELLKEHDLNGILQHEDFEADSMEALSTLFASITPTEWEKLGDKESQTTYDWDPAVEGFFQQLNEIPKYATLFQVLCGSMVIRKQIQDLSDAMTTVEDSLEAVHSCDELSEVCLKLLAIGNCLNAGESRLGRADGFDVLDLIDGQLLKNLPKVHGMSLLTYLQEKELSEECKASFKELAGSLEGWKPLSPGEKDPADINEFKNEIGRLSRSLGSDRDRLRAAFGATLEGKLLEFQDGFKEHRQAIDDLMSRLDDMPESLLEVQNLIQLSKKDENAGRVLRTLAGFAQQLG